MPPETALISAVVYALCVVACLAELLRDLRNEAVAFQRRNRNLLFGLVILMFLVRVGWSIAEYLSQVAYGDNTTPPDWQWSYCMNHVALLLFFSVLLEVFYGWMRFTRRAILSVSKLRVAIVVINVLIWTSQVVLYVLNALAPTNFTCASSNVFDGAAIILIGVASLLVALCFLVYAVCLHIRPPLEKCVEYHWADDSNGAHPARMPKRGSMLPIFCAMVISVLSLVRAFLFSYGPLTCKWFDKPLSDYLYPWFYIVVPDVVGIAAMLAATNNTLLFDTLQLCTHSWRRRRTRSGFSLAHFGAADLRESLASSGVGP